MQLSSSAYAIPGLKASREYIFNDVCEFFNVPEYELTGACRKTGIVLPRFIAIYLLTIVTDCSITNIGIMFNRHHSSIIHARDSIIEKLSMKGYSQESIIVKTFLNKYGYSTNQAI